MREGFWFSNTLMKLSLLIHPALLAFGGTFMALPAFAQSVEIVRPGPTFKEIQFVPSGLQSLLEEVLIVTEGVHQRIPDSLPGLQAPVYLQPPLPPGLSEKPRPLEEVINSMKTDADRLRERYLGIGSKQTAPGQPAPDYNQQPPPPKPILPSAQAPPPASVPPKPGGN